MKKIFLKYLNLNGETYCVGDKVVTLGLDMQCHKCVTEGRITRVSPMDNEVILESEGINIKLKIEDLKTMYVDSPKNREMLQQQCDGECSKWEESVNKMLKGLKN